MLLLCTSGFNHCAISSAAKFISNVKWHLLKNIYGQENDCIKAALLFHRSFLQVFRVRAAHFIDEITQPAMRLVEAAVKQTAPALLQQTAFRKTTPSQKLSKPTALSTQIIL